jgi:hypothetical protein
MQLFSKLPSGPQGGDSVLTRFAMPITKRFHQLGVDGAAGAGELDEHGPGVVSMPMPANTMPRQKIRQAASECLIQIAPTARKRLKSRFGVELGQPATDLLREGIRVANSKKFKIGLEKKYFSNLLGQTPPRSRETGFMR